MSPNRIVAVLTPLVFAPLAGVIATWAAKNLPGVDIPPDKIEQIFIAGALIALAPAAQWLHGWQRYEQRREDAVSAANTGFALAVGGVAAPPVAIEPSGGEYAGDEYAGDEYDKFEDTSVAGNGRLAPAEA